MTLVAARPVIVKQLPENCDPAHSRSFIGDLTAELARTVRPSVVLDCSLVHKLNSAALDLILCCLEETMKRNGDVRLAGIPPEARTSLETAGVRHLFRIFETCSDAIKSYQRPAVERVPQTYIPAHADAAADAA